MTLNVGDTGTDLVNEVNANAAAASAAQSAAASAASAASAAQSDADAAGTLAASAQSTADGAASAASTADGKADTAQSTADAASSAASTADGKAVAAQADADAAQAAADAAQVDADAAQATADTKANASNVLQRDNVAAYTPTLSTHPATVGYVDAATGAASLADLVIPTLEAIKIDSAGVKEWSSDAAIVASRPLGTGFYNVTYPVSVSSVEEQVFGVALVSTSAHGITAAVHATTVNSVLVRVTDSAGSVVDAAIEVTRTTAPAEEAVGALRGAKGQSGNGLMGKDQAEPILLVCIGEFNTRTDKTDGDAAVTNPDVFDWQATSGAPSTYAWVIADPNRTDYSAAGNFVGMRGGGTANWAWEAADALQKERGGQVYMVQVTTDNKTTDLEEWQTGTLGVLVRTTVDAALADGSAPALATEFPDVLLCDIGFADREGTYPVTGHRRDTAESFAADFLNVLVYGSLVPPAWYKPHHTHTLVLPHSSELDFWAGHIKLVDASDESLAVLSPSGYAVDGTDKEEFMGDSLRRLGQQAARLVLNGPTSKVPRRENYVKGDYIFADSRTDPVTPSQSIPTSRGNGSPIWTPVLWPTVEINTTNGVTLNADGYTWDRTDDEPEGLGLWMSLAYVGWENTNAALVGPHRRMIRMMTMTDGLPLPGAQAEITFTPITPTDLDSVPTIMGVSMQDGWSGHPGGQKFWIEVCHDAEVDINIVTEGIIAPLFMAAKMSHW